jgi:hypothetical protein
VCAQGGYVNNYTYDKDVHNYNIHDKNIHDKNMLRFFAANDRPSGTRFMYMLLNGNKEEINEYAFGGYYSKVDDYIVQRRDKGNLCDTLKQKGGKPIKLKNNYNTKTQSKRLKHPHLRKTHKITI